MFLGISDDQGLVYDYRAPAKRDGYTFVCFNPLTGDKSMWEDGCGRSLLGQGHGLLTWNMRGQAGSPFRDGDIHEAGIVDDGMRLLAHVKPLNPVFVGLSVGGLYGAKILLRLDHQNMLDRQGVRGLVLINTLREIGPRLAWINSALVRLAQTGGLDLLRDIYSPLLMNEQWQADNRGDFLKADAYKPISESDGAWHLLKAGEASTWDVNWSDITVPVLNITGLQDRVFRDQAVIAKLLSKFKNVRSIDYAEAGHMVPAEVPQTLAADIAKFVGGIS